MAVFNHACMVETAGKGAGGLLCVPALLPAQPLIYSFEIVGLSPNSSISGVFIPTFLVWSILSYVAILLLTKMLKKTGIRVNK